MTNKQWTDSDAKFPVTLPHANTILLVLALAVLGGVLALSLPAPLFSSTNLLTAFSYGVVAAFLLVGLTTLLGTERQRTSALMAAAQGLLTVVTLVTALTGVTLLIAAILQFLH